MPKVCAALNQLGGRMGLFSWLAATGRKSEAAALIQQYFEVSQRLGYFPGDPAGAANWIVELACNRVPELAEKWKGFVFASAALAIAVLEEDLSAPDREQCAMALAGVVKAANLTRHLHSYEDQRMLEVAQRVYSTYRELVPEPAMSAPSNEVLPPDEESAERPETAKDRARAMDELIRQMGGR